MDTNLLELAKMINSQDFQRRLAELIAAKEAAETAKEQSAKAKQEVDAVMSAMESARLKNKAELESSMTEHDKSAAEAALRIDLANKLKSELDSRQENLDARERALEEREKAVDAAHGSFSSALRQLGLAT